MAENSLKLNDSKTDFIAFGSKHSLKECTTRHITIGDSVVEKSDATLDNHLKLNKQINLVCKYGWFSLYQIRKIKRCLSEDQLKSVMQAFVS